jgi:hypothetical protein
MIALGSASRSHTHTVPGGIEISIPPHRSYIVLLALGFGILMNLLMLFQVGPLKGQPVLLATLQLIACAGVAALLAPKYAAREVLVVEADALTIRREMLGFVSSQRYSLRVLRNLRIEDDRHIEVLGIKAYGRRVPSGLAVGPFAFDYGTRRIRFGHDLKPDEAQDVLSQLIAANPALAGKAA